MFRLTCSEPERIRIPGKLGQKRHHGSFGSSYVRRSITRFYERQERTDPLW